MRSDGKVRISPRRAHITQRILSSKIIQKDLSPRKIRYVGGVDVAFKGDYSIGAVVILESESLQTVEAKTAIAKTKIPYIPTLLAFREVPPALSAVKRLSTMPDVLLVDGHGLAHPYRMGFASHLGLLLPIPTVGVAKSLLCGEVQSRRSGEGWRVIVHKGEVVGAEVITVKGVKPVYVSVGNRISLEKAVEIVSHSARSYRIPEPIRHAHMEAKREKERLKLKIS